MFLLVTSLLVLFPVSVSLLVGRSYSQRLSFTNKQVNNNRPRFDLKSALESQKDSLLTAFDAESEDVFVCPASLNPMKRKRRFYGFYSESYFEEPDLQQKYSINDDYFDLTIKEETEKPIWTLTLAERVGERFFQNPILPFLYERGYRQNFEVLAKHYKLHSSSAITQY